MKPNNVEMALIEVDLEGKKQKGFCEGKRQQAKAYSL